jgi:hypothetical protein
LWADAIKLLFQGAISGPGKDNAISTTFTFDDLKSQFTINRNK